MLGGGGFEWIYVDLRGFICGLTDELVGWKMSSCSVVSPSSNLPENNPFSGHQTNEEIRRRRVPALHLRPFRVHVVLNSVVPALCEKVVNVQLVGVPLGGTGLHRLS